MELTREEQIALAIGEWMLIRQRVVEALPTMNRDYCDTHVVPLVVALYCRPQTPHPAAPGGPRFPVHGRDDQ